MAFSLVHFGVDLRDDRAVVAQDDPCRVQAVLLAEAGRGVVPKPVGVPAVGPGRLPLPPEPLPTAKITWQNILLILVALLVVGAIGAMIVWTHFY